MHTQSKAWKRLVRVSCQLLGRLRALERASERTIRQRVFMRVHVEMLQPRVLMSVSPTGTETLVNTTTAYVMQNPAVAMNPAGNCVVVWTTAASGGEVLGQRYNINGNPVGGQFQVNQSPAGTQAAPSVAIDGVGDFVVAWDGLDSSAYVRVFNSSGSPITGDTLVTASLVGTSRTVVAMNASGAFVVAWEGNGSSDNDGIYAQDFLEDGLASGSVFLVNSTTTGSQTNPSIAMDSAGDFVVAWTDNSTAQSTIQAAYFPSSGAAVSQFAAGTEANGAENDSSVGIDSSGSFIIAWQTNFGSSTSWDINARDFSAGASPATANPVTVNTVGDTSQASPAVAMRADGSYLVAWESEGQDGSGLGVYAQAFTATGALDGSVFLVNTTTSGNQQDPAAAWTGDTAVIAWDGSGAGDSAGVFLQRYTTSGAVNQQPANAIPGSQAITENNTLRFSSTSGNAVAISDSDADGGVEQLALSATNGSLALAAATGLTFSSGSNGSGAMTFTGTVANINADLAGMVFTPTSNFVGTAKVQLVTDDLGNTGSGGPASITSSFTITIHSPPTSDTVPGGQTAVENTALVFSPPNDNAIYIGTGWNYMELQATHGTLTLSTTSGLSFDSGNGTNNATMEFAGSIAAMNAAVNGLIFTPTSGYTGSASIKMVTSNDGLLGLGLFGSSSTSTIAITVTAPAAAVNHPPAVSVPGAQTTAEGTALVLGGSNAISVADSDADGNSEQVTLIATSGTLTLAATSGLTFSTGSGTGAADMTFTGTIASINSALGGLTFTPAPVFYGSGGVYAAIDDLGNTGTGGAKTATATVAINITESNQPPAVAVPVAQSVAENGTLAFSSAGGNAIVVSDIDADGAGEEVTLTAANGTVSLGSLTNLTIDAGGNGQSTLTVTGTLPDLNAALDTLTFMPTAGFVGSTSVQILADDLGNTGAGGPKTATNSVSISVIQSLVVTTALDVDNGNASSIANLLADPGPDGISLREAMLAINNTPGSYAISFDIPGGGVQTITLASALGALPTMSNGMIIDGTTQPGYAGSPLIVVDGSGLVGTPNGFTVDAENCAIVGLAIDNFGGDGINVSGVNGATIQADYVGLNAAGASAPNGTGIVLSNSAGDVVGGASAAQRNIISGNTNDGIDLTGPGTTGDVVGGNFIGTNPAGTAAVANGGVGMSILGGASGNSIGASTAQANLADYFNRPGIVADGSTFTEGFDGGGSAFSSTLLGNSLVWNGNAYTFGPVGADDVVYGTGQTIPLPTGFDSTLTFLGAGVYGDQLNQTFTVTYTDNSTQTFTQSLGDWFIATSYSGQSIAAATSYRDTFTGGMNAGPWDLFGYTFALNSAKAIASITLPNNHDVVLLAIDTSLAVSTTGNVISGNTGYGVEISGTSSTDNVVQSNFIGTSAAGTSSISNGDDGVLLNDTTGNTIGGTSPTDRNVISANANVANSSDGIWIDGGSSNIVQGNYIGTDASGTVALGNANDGITISSSTGNLIGGATAGAGNVISGNNNFGLEIDGPSSSGNLIQGNFIGTNAAGTASISNGNDGIWLNDVTGVTIGGTLAGDGNLISGNTNAAEFADGIWIDGGSGNTVQGNLIGTDITGAANLGNYHDGIEIESSSDNLIGGTSAGAGNTIAFNSEGVTVWGGGAIGNSILENSIFGNTTLGIDLGNNGITANTGALNSSLANDGMNFPVFTSVTLAGDTLSVAGYVGTAPDQPAFAGAQIDLFRSDNSQANGEGKTWLASLVADSSGDFTGSFNVTGLSVGDIITATAMDGTGDTSEFSANDTIAPAPVAHTPSVTNATTDENQQSTSGLIITPNPLDGSTTIYFQITNISGGSLFLSDGVTALADDDFITAAQGEAGLQFTPAPNSTTPGGFDVQASLTSDDSGLGGSVVAAIVTVIGPPTLTINSSPLAYTQGQGAVAVDPQLTVFDPFSATLASATVTLSGYLAGEDLLGFTFQNGIGGTWNSTTGVLTLTGTASPAFYQEALESVTYTDESLDPSTAPRSAQFTAGDGTLVSAPAIQPISVTAVNLPPAIAAPTTLSAVEDTPITFAQAASAIVITDIDANGGIEQASLSVSAGTLTLSDTTGLTFVNGTTNSSGLLTFTGTLASIDSALSTLALTEPLHFTGSATLSVTADDLGNTGVGGPMTDEASITINVAPVAHDPAVTNAATYQDTQTSSGLVISPSPIDAGQSIWFQITDITGGSLLLSDGTTRIVSGDFITAAQGQAGLKFTPAQGRTSPGSFDVQASLAPAISGLNGNIVQAAIAVTAFTAPVNTAPASETVGENTPLVFSASGGDAISVSNSDNAAQQVTLAAANGTLTLATTAGLTLLAGTGSGDATVTFNGLPSAINAALDGLTFIPAANFAGPVAIQIASEDLISAAAGHPLSAQSSVAVNVTAPVIPPTQQIVTDNGLTTEADVVATITPAALAAAESGASSDQLTFTITQAPTLGTLLLAGQALHAGSTFTESDIEQGRLTYESSAAQTADDAFTFIVTDAAGASTPAAVFQIHTVGIVAPPPPVTVTPNPVLTLPAAPVEVPPVDITGPSTVSPVFDTGLQGGNQGGIQGGSNTVVAPPTPGALDSTSNRVTLITAVSALPVGPVLAPVFPHAPPANAVEVAAPVVASAVRSDGVVPGNVDVPIPSRSSGHVFPNAAPGAGIKGPYAGLGSTNGTGAKDGANPKTTFDHSSPAWRQLDAMETQITSERKIHIVAGTASLVSLGMSVAYFMWAVRAGSVLSSLLSSMPAWKLVDPLPILDQFAGTRRRRNLDGITDAEADDDETLESMLDGPRKAA